MVDDLMDDRRCSATSKQSGERCKRSAIVGGSVCAMHGGKTPRVVAAAEQRVARRAAETALREGLAAAYGDQVPDVDPAEAMLQAVSWKYAECVALRVKVAELEDDQRVWGVTKTKDGGDDAGTTQEAKPNIWWQMLHQAENQLVAFAKAARAAGCDEQRVKLAENAGRLLSLVVQQILAALELSDVQLAMVPEVVPAAFRSVAALEAGAS